MYGYVSVGSYDCEYLICVSTGTPCRSQDLSVHGAELIGLYTFTFTGPSSGERSVLGGGTSHVFPEVVRNSQKVERGFCYVDRLRSPYVRDSEIRQWTYYVRRVPSPVWEPCKRQMGVFLSHGSFVCPEGGFDCSSLKSIHFLFVSDEEGPVGQREILIVILCELKVCVERAGSFSYTFS